MEGVCPKILKVNRIGRRCFIGTVECVVEGRGGGGLWLGEGQGLVWWEGGGGGSVGVVVEAVVVFIVHWVGLDIEPRIDEEIKIEEVEDGECEPEKEGGEAKGFAWEETRTNVCPEGEREEGSPEEEGEEIGEGGGESV